jgi:serine/threonine protein kinase
MMIATLKVFWFSQGKTPSMKTFMIFYFLFFFSFSLGPTKYNGNRYAYDTALGMAFLHKQLVIHRDLKAGNLLVTSEDHVKVVSFMRDQSSLSYFSFYVCSFLSHTRLSHSFSILSFLCSLACYLLFIFSFFGSRIMKHHRNAIVR